MRKNKIIILFIVCVLCVVFALVGCDNTSDIPDNIPDNTQPEQTPSGSPDSTTTNPSPSPMPNPNPANPIPTPDPPIESENGNEILVVYFSYSGTTERVANAIAEQLGTQAIEIAPEIAYTAQDTNYNNSDSRNRRELAQDLRPAISSVTYDEIVMSKYKAIVIGYPIWNGYEPMIIRTFIEHYDGLRGKEVYTFSTSASSSGSSAHNGLKNRYTNTDIKTNLHLTSSAMSSMSIRVEQWLTQNNLAKEDDMIDTLYLKIGNTTLTATLVDNSSTRALIELLKIGPITIDMSDYANFEKVGELGTTLPRNDEQITTQAGDLILYLGSRFVIYYDTNSWNFTRLGKINNVTQDGLKQILGRSNVTIELSLSI